MDAFTRKLVIGGCIILALILYGRYQLNQIINNLKEPLSQYIKLVAEKLTDASCTVDIRSLELKRFRALSVRGIDLSCNNHLIKIDGVELKFSPVAIISKGRSSLSGGVAAFDKVHPINGFVKMDSLMDLETLTFESGSFKFVRTPLAKIAPLWGAKSKYGGLNLRSLQGDLAADMQIQSKAADVQVTGTFTMYQVKVMADLDRGERAFTFVTVDGKIVYNQSGFRTEAPIEMNLGSGRKIFWRALGSHKNWQVYHQNAAREWLGVGLIFHCSRQVLYQMMQRPAASLFLRSQNSGNFVCDLK